MAAHNIDGRWRGHYSYATNPDAGSAFDAEFTDETGGLSGEIHDDERLGLAVLSGVYSFPNIQFTKMYVQLKLSPVEYTGTMSEDGKTIRGKWLIREKGMTVRGSWMAHRVDPPEAKSKQKTRSEVVEQV